MPAKTLEEDEAEWNRASVQVDELRDRQLEEEAEEKARLVAKAASEKLKNTG